jgi:hypothetical protein
VPLQIVLTLVLAVSRSIAHSVSNMSSCKKLAIPQPRMRQCPSLQHPQLTCFQPFGLAAKGS